MKEKYINPEMEVIKFKTADIITTSGLDDDELPKVDPEI